MNKKKIFLISFFLIIIFAICFAIVVTNKQEIKGTFTVFDVNSSETIITGNGKKMILKDMEREKFIKLIKKIVNDNVTIENNISEVDCDLKIDFCNGYVAYLWQDKNALLFEDEVKKIEDDDFEQINEYISRMN